MRRFALLSVATLFLLLVCSTAFGQAEPTIFVEVDYMRSLSPDYAELETEIWKPIHQERIERGRMLGWALYSLRFGDRQDHDYITVNVYDSIDDALDFGPVEELIEAAHPTRSAEDVMASLESREIVRSELWTLIDGVGMEETQTRPRFLVLNCMNVPPGGEEAYVDLELETWKPIHEAGLPQGGMARWGLYALNWPYGSQEDCQYGTANEYTSFDDGPSYQEIAEEVHPERPWNELVSQTMASRDLVSGILYELVDSTD